MTMNPPVKTCGQKIIVLVCIVQSFHTGFITQILHYFVLHTLKVTWLMLLSEIQKEKGIAILKTIRNIVRHKYSCSSLKFTQNDKYSLLITAQRPSPQYLHTARVLKRAVALYNEVRSVFTVPCEAFHTSKQLLQLWLRWISHPMFISYRNNIYH